MTLLMLLFIKFQTEMRWINGKFIKVAILAKTLKPNNLNSYIIKLNINGMHIHTGMRSTSSDDKDGW